MIDSGWKTSMKWRVLFMIISKNYFRCKNKKVIESNRVTVFYFIYSKPLLRWYSHSFNHCWFLFFVNLLRFFLQKQFNSFFWFMAYHWRSIMYKKLTQIFFGNFFQLWEKTVWYVFQKEVAHVLENMLLLFSFESNRL